jgi:hypothetical protein
MAVAVSKLFWCARAEVLTGHCKSDFLSAALGAPAERAMIAVAMPLASRKKVMMKDPRPTEQGL